MRAYAIRTTATATGISALAEQAVSVAVL